MFRYSWEHLIAQIPSLAWEGVLLDTTRATQTTYYGWLSGFSSNIGDTMTQLSHVFSRIAATYPITNFIEGIRLGNYGLV